ncbi:MAG: 1-acyl-sn-glycerol-3-phosphate acyltransferase [SAR324 cluster bacterium]|nr:1-acyl-sn-glycerol-3-phosphate acyltransferase [SAR324 cluster bacterium]
MRFHTFWIMGRVVAYTLRITIVTIYEVYRGIYRREDGDSRLRWWAAKIMESVKLTYTAFNPFKVSFQPGKPYIIMSNHSSLFDIPLTFLGLPGSIRMLTKKELFKIPIWGKGMQVAEFIPIDRHNRQQAIQDLEKARKKMESGIILWVAPEGTRSRTGQLLPFKKGGFRLALQTGATIVPVGIRGANQVLPPGTWDIRLQQHVEVHIGSPIDATTYEHNAHEQLMKDVEKQIRELSNLPQASQQVALS